MGYVRVAVGRGLWGVFLWLVFVPRADGYVCEWQRKYHQLEERVTRYESELASWQYKYDWLLSAYQNIYIPNLCSRSGVPILREIHFRQTPLLDAVDTLNAHAAATGTNAVADGIARRLERIQQLELEIESLRQMKDQDRMLREVRLDLPEGMERLGEMPITFSAMDISVREAIEIITDICRITYEADNGVVRLVPRVEYRPIPRDALSRALIVAAVESMYGSESREPLCFSEAGLQKALAEGFVEEVLEKTPEPFDFPSSIATNVLFHHLSSSGLERFGYLVVSDPFRAGDRVCVVTPDSHPLAWPRDNNLYARTVPRDVRLLRAVPDVEKDVVFRDFDTGDLVIDAGLEQNWRTLLLGDRAGRHVSGAGDFLRPSPPPKIESGVFVYYAVDLEGIRSEDHEYFVRDRQYRLEKLHEHELGYFLRFPRYLRPPVEESEFFGAPVW